MPVADEVELVLSVNDAAYNAALARDEANFARIIGKMQADADKAGAAFTRVGTAAGRALPRIAQDAKQAGTAIQGTITPIGNMAAQIQDIGVQLASGQSPFLILAQQLPQITQHGGSLNGVMGALRQTVSSLISPLGLVTTGFTLAAGVAITYFSRLLADGDDAELTLKQQEQLIERIADRWGAAVPALKAYNDEIKRNKELADIDTTTGILRRDQYSPLLPVIRKLREELDQLPRTGNYGAIYEKFERLAKGVENGTATVQDLQRAVLEARTMFINNGVPAADEFAKSLNGIEKQLNAISEAADEMGRKLRAALPREETPFYDPRDPRYTPAGILPRSVPAPSFLGPGDVGPNPGMRNFDETLGDAADAIDAFVQRVVKAESGGRTDAKNPNSSATGVGQFIESTWLDLFRKYYPAQAQTMGRDAILELRKNADVSYALIVKYAEENARVLQAAGVHVDEAALQLAHFLGAGDAAKVLRAASGTPLQGLISQASINANPTILGGNRTVDDAIAYAQRRASGGTGGGGKSPSDIFQGSVEQIEARIDAMNAEIEAVQGLTAGTNEYALALEKARIYQQLLTDAKKAEVELTPELLADLDRLAENYAKVAVARQNMNKDVKAASREAREAAEFEKDVLGGFIQDLIAGKDAADALADALSKVADRLLDLALDSLFSAAPSGVFLGGLLSLFGGRRARGGPVRTGRAYLVGERGPEVFSPSQSGRIIPNVPGVAAMGGMRGGSITLKVIGEEGPMFRPTIQAVSTDTSVKVVREGIGSYDKSLTNSFGARMQRAGQRTN